MSKVSILIPVYGVEKYIARCAHSIFNQTYQDIEIIFVDDASKDKSIQILEEVIEQYPQIKPKVKIITHKTNMGLACARNSAVKAATGKYLIHIDSDDYVSDKFIEKLVTEAELKNADITVCNYIKETRHGLKKIEVPISLSHIEYTKMLLTRKTNVQIVFKLYNRNLYIRNNIEAIPGVNNGEDYSTVSRLSYNARKICKVNDFLYYYNQMNESSYTYHITEKAIKEKILAQKIIYDFFSSIEEKDLYAQALIDSFLYQKLSLFIASNIQYYPIINNLYNDINILHSQLPLSHKIILTLARFKFYRTIFSVIKIKKLIS